MLPAWTQYKDRWLLMDHTTQLAVVRLNSDGKFQWRIRGHKARGQADTPELAMGAASHWLTDHSIHLYHVVLPTQNNAHVAWAASLEQAEAHANQFPCAAIIQYIGHTPAALVAHMNSGGDTTIRCRHRVDS